MSNRTASYVFMRRGRDSNPRYAFGVYSLSRRASSTTPAPLQSCVCVRTKIEQKCGLRNIVTEK